MTDHDWPVLTTALTALQDVTGGLTAEQLAAPSPCSEWTAGQVIEHAGLDQLIWVASVSGGENPDGNAFAPTGALADPAGSFIVGAAATAGDAWRAVAAGSTVPTPLPHGRLDAEIASGAAALDAAVHAWDIAVAVGRPSPLTADLAAALQPTAEAIVEPLRQWGAYAAALSAESGDDAVATLLRYLGRDPHWTR